VLRVFQEKAEELRCAGQVLGISPDTTIRVQRPVPDIVTPNRPSGQRKAIHSNAVVSAPGHNSAKFLKEKELEEQRTFKNLVSEVNNFSMSSGASSEKVLDAYYAFVKTERSHRATEEIMRASMPQAVDGNHSVYYSVPYVRNSGHQTVRMDHAGQSF